MAEMLAVLVLYEFEGKKWYGRKTLYGRDWCEGGIKKRNKALKVERDKMAQGQGTAKGDASTSKGQK